MAMYRLPNNTPSVPRHNVRADAYRILSGGITPPSPNYTPPVIVSSVDDDFSAWASAA